MNFKPIMFESVPSIWPFSSGSDLQGWHTQRPSISQLKGWTGAVQVGSVLHTCLQSLILRHRLPRKHLIVLWELEGKRCLWNLPSEVSHGPLPFSSRHCFILGSLLFSGAEFSSVPRFYLERPAHSWAPVCQLSARYQGLLSLPAKLSLLLNSPNC